MLKIACLAALLCLAAPLLATDAPVTYDAAHASTDDAVQTPAAIKRKSRRSICPQRRMG